MYGGKAFFLTAVMAAAACSSLVVSAERGIETRLKAPVKRIAPPKALAATIVSREGKYLQPEERGIYRFVVSKPEDGWERISEDTRFDGRDGAILCGYRYLVAQRQTFSGVDIIDYNLFDASTWRHEKRMSGDAESASAALTYNPSDGLVYGYFRRLDGSYMFATLNPSDGRRIMLRGGLSVSPVAMAAGGDGTLYAVTADGQLAEVSPSDGTFEILFDGLPQADTSCISSAVIDPADGCFYYSCSRSDGSGLYLIDLENQTWRHIADYDAAQNVSGLMSVLPLAPDGAPDSAVLLGAAPDDDSMEGTVRFAVSSTLYDGSDPGDTEVFYSLEINGEEYASGVTSWGATEAVDVVYEVPGLHTVTVYLYNRSGSSPAAARTFWVGKDHPSSPENVKLEYNAQTGRYRLMWDPPTSTVHGGWADLSDLTYEVIRMPRGIRVAEGLRQTVFEETVEDPQKLGSRGYAVRAFAGELGGQETVSPMVPTGRLDLPATLRPGTDFEIFTVLDANGDGRTWTPAADGSVGVDYSAIDMDDWIFLPAVDLEQGLYYPLQFDIWGGSSSYDEKFEVRIGKAPEPAAMTSTILTARTVSGRFDVSRGATVTVGESGTYYIGFHGCSGRSSLRLNLDNITLGGAMVTGTASHVGNLRIVPDPDGKPSFTVSFDAPRKTVDGKPLNHITGIKISANGKTVGTLADVSAGSHHELDIELDDPGICRLRVIAYIGNVAGQVENRTFYCGTNVPAHVSGLKAEYVERNGGFRLVWNAPASDADGYDIVPGIVSYRVTDSFGRLMTEIKGQTEVLLPVGAATAVAGYSVIPFTDAGSPAGRPATIVAMVPGRQTELPFEDNISEFSTSDNWASESGGYGMMIVAAEEDPNNRILRMTTPSSGGSAILKSGYFRICGQENVIMFDYRVDNPELVGFSLDGIMPDGTRLPGIIVSDDVVAGPGLQSGPSGWICRVGGINVPDGDVMAFELRVRTIGESVFELDNIRIVSDPGIEIISFDAPEEIAGVDDLKVSGWVRNSSPEKCLSSELVVCDGNLGNRIVDRFTLQDMRAGGYAPFEVTLCPTAVYGDMLSYNIMTADNQVSFSISLDQEPVEAPSGLTAEILGDTDGRFVMLSWKKTDPSVNIPEGYRLYRNFDILATVGSEYTEFPDHYWLSSRDEGELCDYHVTALYRTAGEAGEAGRLLESAPCSLIGFNADVAGIAEHSDVVDHDIRNSARLIYHRGGEVMTDVPDGSVGCVSDLAGRICGYAGKGKTLSLPAGTYIVRIVY